MITIEVFGEQEHYRSLKCFEFDADRKMMTRIVQNTKNGKVTAYCKGADSSILHRCTEQDQAITNSIDKFSHLGLRTLAFA